jgi:hypothetical protein
MVCLSFGSTDMTFPVSRPFEPRKNLSSFKTLVLSVVRRRRLKDVPVERVVVLGERLAGHAEHEDVGVVRGPAWDPGRGAGPHLAGEEVMTGQGVNLSRRIDALHSVIVGDVIPDGHHEECDQRGVRVVLRSL